MQRVLEAELTTLVKLDEAIQEIRNKAYYAWIHGGGKITLELWQETPASPSHPTKEVDPISAVKAG